MLLKVGLRVSVWLFALNRDKSTDSGKLPTVLARCLLRGSAKASTELAGDVDLDDDVSLDLSCCCLNSRGRPLLPAVSLLAEFLLANGDLIDPTSLVSLTAFSFSISKSLAML